MDSSGFRARPLMAPEPPRQVHSSSARNVESAGRLRRLFGAIYAGVALALTVVLAVVAALTGAPLLALIGGLVGGAFALAAAVAWGSGAAARRRAEALLRDGVEAEGAVVSVALQRHTRMNGRSPWRIEYEFTDAQGRAVRAHMLSWDPSPPRVKPGDAVVVLHDARDPAQSILWTPLHDEAASDAANAAAAGAVAAPVPRTADASQPGGVRVQSEPERAASEPVLEVEPAGGEAEGTRRTS